jgi:hypothetical protein
MTVKGSDVPEFVDGFEHARSGGAIREHASRPWKRGYKAYQLQAKWRRKFQRQEQFAVV